MVTINEGDIVVHYKRYGCAPEDLEKEPYKYLYRIVGLAYDCTSEKGTLVVYQALYGRKKLFSRTIEDFLTYVPSAERYKFEKYESGETE